MSAAAAKGHHPAPDDLDDNTFVYYVWVCEVMSQQTQVSRAAEYFRNWVKKWPDVEALAAATQDEVNDAWAGLGYYRRARYLLDGAKYVVDKLEGNFPKTSKELQKIPGVGPYTAAAIASIACGERTAVVDGNVIRVMARLRRISGDTRNSTMTKLFSDISNQAIDPERPGCFNQAVMELGATVCVPNAAPLCKQCPIQKWCHAYQAQMEYRAGSGPPVSVTDYPSKVEKAEKREESVSIAVVQVVPSEDDIDDVFAGHFLLLKRPPGGLLAGLWEFPLAQVLERDAKNSVLQQCTDRLLSDTFSQLALAWPSSRHDGANEVNVKILQRRQLGQLVHIFSHIRMTMHVERIVIHCDIVKTMEETKQKNSKNGEETIQWLTAEQLESKGLTSGVKKVWKLYGEKSKKKPTASQGIHRFFKPIKKT